MQKNFKTFINEIRRSEKLVLATNKAFGHSVAKTYLQNIKEQGADLDLYGVTMTELPKVGINPRSEYSTPIGIYFYPAKYYLKTIELTIELPFQHNAPYINIIKLNPNKDSDIVMLGDIDEKRLKDDITKLNVKEINLDDSLVKTPGGKWWYISYKLSNDNPRKWNSILRKDLGVKAVIDNLGEGIIHRNEPDAGVILDSTIATVVKRIDNKSKDDIKRRYLSSKKPIHPKKEDSIAKDPELAYEYARDVLKGPYPKGEDAIAKNSKNAYEYANYVLKGPFPKGEDAIAKDSFHALKYAAYVLKGPFPKGEDAIATNLDYVFNYAGNVLKGPFPKGEDAIAKDSLNALKYAAYVLKGRFPKGEDTIAKNPDHAFEYARYVLKGPFPKGEDAIATNSLHAYEYARDVLKGPFPKGEDTINKNPYYKKLYQEFLNKTSKQQLPKKRSAK